MNKNAYSPFGSELPVAIYCSPAPELKDKDRVYKSKITAEQYDRIKELGVNLIYGHEESIGGESEKEVFKALDLCAERGMLYLVRDEIFKEYSSLGEEIKAYDSLTKEEKADLDERLVFSLKKYCKHKAFGGIVLKDEPGIAMFEGLRRAKELFADMCPNKLCYINMFGYWVTPEQYIFGQSKIDVAVSGEIVNLKEKEQRYDFFMENYIKTLKPDVYSYDLYPIVSLGGLKMTVHKALYELLDIVRSKCDKYGISFWNFLQGGGRWEDSLSVRPPNYAEVALQVNVSLALGARGLQIFPYCFPFGWKNDKNVDAGLLSLDGSLTDRYYYFRRAIRQAKACEKVIMNGTYKGYMCLGEFFGLLPKEEQLLSIKDNDCIYNGSFIGSGELKGFKPIKKMTTTSQVLIGCFEYMGGYAISVVNNSVVVSLSASIEFDKSYIIESIIDGSAERACCESFDIDILAAGESCMIILHGE